VTSGEAKRNAKQLTTKTIAHSSAGKICLLTTTTGFPTLLLLFVIYHIYIAGCHGLVVAARNFFLLAERIITENLNNLKRGNESFEVIQG